jgi:hypothetical protein
MTLAARHLPCLPIAHSSLPFLWFACMREYSTDVVKTFF